MKNLEIKTRYPDLDLARQIARSLSAQDMGASQDVDTYFRVSHGRLKLRQTEDGSQDTLIYYERPDRAESRYSEYHLAPVGAPETTKTLLDGALGTLVTVTKTRHLFLYGMPRIHLDQVEGLRRFVELETAIREQTEEAARSEHELVKKALDLDRQEIVAAGYGDLLLER